MVYVASDHGRQDMDMETTVLDKNDNKLSDFAYLDAMKVLIRKGFNVSLLGGDERRYRIQVSFGDRTYKIGVGTRRKVRDWNPDTEATAGVQAMIGVDYSNSRDYSSPDFYIALVDSDGRAPIDAGARDRWDLLRSVI
jgi:hypothetical protein